MQMESLQSEDGQNFIRSLAQFIRQHEKALANSLQLSVHRRQTSANASTSSLNGVTSGTALSSTNNSSLAAALSFTGLHFRSHTVKSALMTLTPHHLFYLLSRVEELGITVGPMNVRIENLVHDVSPTNYVSFLQTRPSPGKGRSDKDSMHSVSSVRSVMSSMTTFWAAIGLGGSSKTEKAKAAAEADLKYLYSSFTKLPSLRLTSDHRARLIKGYEEFPFDTAVPLFAFKNLQQLDIVDLDFRQFCGWDRLAEQLTLLTVKRGHVEDPAELLTDIVLDDIEKRRRRSTKGGRQSSPTPTWSWTVPSTPRADYAQSHSDSGSPPGNHEENSHRPGPNYPARIQRSQTQYHHSPRLRYDSQTNNSTSRPHYATSDVLSTSRPRHGKDAESVDRPRYSVEGLLIDDNITADHSMTVIDGPPPHRSDSDRATDIVIAGSVSPKRPNPTRPTSAYRHVRAYSTYSTKYTRSSSGSSTSSDPYRRSESASNLLAVDHVLPQSKWQRLKYLSLADNGMTFITPHSFAPVAKSLRSLNLASNLFTVIPDNLSFLTRLVSLDLSNCMIDSLISLKSSPLPAITTLRLKANRLQSLSGIERLLSLENLNVQDNKLTDPTEAARLTGLPNIRRVWLKHNPMTKTHPNWRITVFNLFRQTPGYMEDIIIDDSSPGFAERKSLVERVPEIERTLVTAEPDSQRPTEPPVIIKERERPLTTPLVLPEPLVPTSTKRKKTPRRRIVDLAQEVSPGRTQSDTVTFTRHSMETKETKPDTPSADMAHKLLDTPDAKQEADKDLEKMTAAQAQDEYRAKIEALRREFGSNWLSQLGEQAWHNDHHLNIQQELTHPALHRANTTAIVSGGRTLG